MIELIIRASAEKCFAAFCDVEAARRWVPGLKKVRVVRKDALGRALEASYEGERLSYALVYAYDDDRRRVRWVTSSGVLDGVSGQASFDEHEGGCRFRYALESVKGREATHSEEVAHAFAAWIEAKETR